MKAARALGFINFWTGPVTPSTAMAIWEDDDFQTFLQWGRSAYDSKVLYLHEDQIQDARNDESKTIITCWFFGGIVGHLWTSEPSLRSIQSEMQSLYDDSQEDDDSNLMYGRIESDAGEYFQELVASGRIAQILVDPKIFVSHRSIYDFGYPLVEEATKQRNLSDYHSRIFNNVIIGALVEAVGEHQRELETLMEEHLESLREEIKAQKPDWLNQVVALREDDAKRFLRDKYGLAPRRIVISLARPPKGL